MGDYIAHYGPRRGHKPKPTGAIPLDKVECDVFWYRVGEDRAAIKPVSERAKIYFENRRTGMLLDIRLSLQQFRAMFSEPSLIQLEEPYDG